jgi:sulfatase maturation enzyme AslB (radical SAM superfamily)
MDICYDPFKNISIVSMTNGPHSGNGLQVAPCCNARPRKTDQIDFENNEYLNEVRQEWSKGIFPMACNPCKQDEDAGLVSRRQDVSKWYQDHELENTNVELMRLDYWTGDLCNLRCAICGPLSSSAWREELKLPIKKVSVNRFWKQLDLSKLKFIHFSGGEPLLSKEHVEFLNAIPDKSQVHINYNTNATVLPDQQLLDLWSKFRLVQIDFSIDDVGDRFEYQRYPAKWSTVVENLQWFLDNAPNNCMFAVNTAVGILNHSNIEQLELWLKNNFHITRFTDPIAHNKQLVWGTFALSSPKQEAIEFLNACDARRGTDWKTIFPELID